jgi:hypothetical protein
MKKTNNMMRLYIYRKLEFLSIFLFALGGLSSLLIFSHCIAVWQRTGEIRENLNIRQLEKMLPEYENYANQRIINYENQLNEAISHKSARNQELIDLGFDLNSNETLKIQKDRKIEKLKQVVRPHIYKELTDTINSNIIKFISVVEQFSPITAPKNITLIEKWTKYYERQLYNFSHYKMKGENADNFHFESTFRNVRSILTEWEDIFSLQRLVGYSIGLAALICMLYPYLKVGRSNKLNY